MSFLQSLQFKVGAMVIGVAALIGYMSLKVTDDPALLSRSQKAWFLLPSAAGLIKNSAVKSAGIPVGVIKNISLQDGQARIDISVKSSVPLTTSAAVEIKANGILGDKYIELYPGSPTEPPMEEGGQILTIKDKGSLDSVISQVGDISTSLKAVAESLREAVSEDGTRRHVLGRIVKNIEVLTQDLSEMTTANKGKIGDIVDQVRDVTATLDDLINDESDKGFKKTWSKTMARIDSTMKNVDEIAAKVNNGQGTIGKLINDETTVEELNTAIQGVSGLLDGASRIQTAFDIHGEYLNKVGGKSYIGVRVQPGLDRYYELGIIDDPAGVVEEESSRTVVDGGTPVLVESQKTFKNKTKFTLLFAKNFWDWSVKGGLIENAGGVGVDYYTLNRKLRFSLEAFDFGKPNLRASARYDLAYGIYLHGGVNDSLDKNSARAGYLGAGLFLTNDDLKLLLTKAPF